MINTKVSVKRLSGSHPVGSRRRSTPLVWDEIQELRRFCQAETQRSGIVLTEHFHMPTIERKRAARKVLMRKHLSVALALLVTTTPGYAASALAPFQPGETIREADTRLLDAVFFEQQFSLVDRMLLSRLLRAVVSDADDQAIELRAGYTSPVGMEGKPSIALLHRFYLRGQSMQQAVETLKVEEPKLWHEAQASVLAQIEPATDLRTGRIIAAHTLAGQFFPVVIERTNATEVRRGRKPISDAEARDIRTRWRITLWGDDTEPYIRNGPAACAAKKQ